MSSSFSDSFGETDLSGEVRFDRRGRFVMYKKLSNPEPMNNPSKSPVPTDESSSTKEPDDSKVHSSEGMAELLLKYIRHKVFESFHCHIKKFFHSQLYFRFKFFLV